MWNNCFMGRRLFSEREMLKFFLLIWERETLKHRFVVPLIYVKVERLIWFEERPEYAPLIYAFSGWFLYVPWLGIKPATLTYQDDALTSWLPGQGFTPNSDAATYHTYAFTGITSFSEPVFSSIKTRLSFMVMFHIKLCSSKNILKSKPPVPENVDLIQ